MIALQALAIAQVFSRMMAFAFVGAVLLAAIGLVLIIRGTRGSLPSRFGWNMQLILAAVLTLSALVVTFKPRATDSDHVVGLCLVTVAAVVTLVVKRWGLKKDKSTDAV